MTAHHTMTPGRARLTQQALDDAMHAAPLVPDATELPDHMQWDLASRLEFVETARSGTHINACTRQADGTAVVRCVGVLWP